MLQLHALAGVASCLGAPSGLIKGRSPTLVGSEKKTMAEAAIPEDYRLSSYDYPLPAEQIAQYPPEVQGASRLMIVNRAGDGPVRAHASFAELGEFLPANCLLVANNTKVLPARIRFPRPGGGRAEFLLLTPLSLLEANGNQAEAECLLRPGAKYHVGETFCPAPDLEARILEKGEFGRHKVKLTWRGDLEAIFRQWGAMPLPPYIKRSADPGDDSRYQTVYAKNTGAVAAPTAGLHFTPEILARVREQGHEWCEICLHTGYGTFSPVRTEDIRQHQMHREFVEIDEASAHKIRSAQESGRAIVAVGTTSLRALEGVQSVSGAIRPYAGWVNIFLYPGKTFSVVNGLITNFHLPASSLLMLVAAFAGRRRILAAYQEALARKYRFFSYGDAMLIL